MAKAKKPVSKTGESKDTTKAEQPTTAGSVPKTTRAKSAASKPTTAKKPAAEKPEPPQKPTTPDSVKSADQGQKKEVSKPVDAKPEESKQVDAKAQDSKIAAPETPKSPAPSSSPVRPTPAHIPATERAERGSVFWPLLLGGVVAAVLGFLASEMNMLGTRGDTTDLREAISTQQDRITELENAEPAVANTEFPALDDLTADVTQLSETIAALEARLTDLEQRPITQGSSDAADAAVAAYERELNALKSSVEEQKSEIEGLLENAMSVEEATAEAAHKATLQASMTRVMAAINNGQPYAAALGELESNGIDGTPDALAATAETGVVTLINLQSRFPNAARAALATARASGAEDSESGVTGFLRRQLGARSVAPREGTDPDAVLSRAEASVRDGRLTDALAELETLPEPAQDAMQDWLDDARARQAAEAAAEDLSQRLTAN